MASLCGSSLPLGPDTTALCSADERGGKPVDGRMGGEVRSESGLKAFCGSAVTAFVIPRLAFQTKEAFNDFFETVEKLKKQATG